MLQTVVHMASPVVSLTSAFGNYFIWASSYEKSSSQPI